MKLHTQCCLVFLVGSFLLVSACALAQDGDQDRGQEIVDDDTGPAIPGRLVLAAIGIDSYQHWPPLDNAVSDAVGFQKALQEKAGFVMPVPPLLNEAATRDAIRSLIDDTLASTLQPDDQLILFFAGHGHTRVVQIGDDEVETGYLVPVSAPAGEDERWSAYLRIDDFLRSVNDLPAKHVLVVLDACHSGFALGSAVDKFRGSEDFKHELSRKVSRRAITSARRDQLASDSGPLPDHSLFTGTFVDGLNWGGIDLDGNGLITSSEIGLFLQQRVGQASSSKQTPDFGAFGRDQRGELVISLNNQSFDALKARAYNALNRGNFADFASLTEQLAQSRPQSPETLYLRYRLSLVGNDVDMAEDAVEKLRDKNVGQGEIPMSQEDLWNLSKQVPFWRPVLELADGDTPLGVEMLSLDGELIASSPFGEVDAYTLTPGTRYRLRFTNRSAETQFVHSYLISETGRMKAIRLWQDFASVTRGLAPGQSSESLALEKSGIAGIEEIRIIAAASTVEELIFPPDAKSRAVMTMKPESKEALRAARRTTVRITNPLPQ